MEPRGSQVDDEIAAVQAKFDQAKAELEALNARAPGRTRAEDQGVAVTALAIEDEHERAVLSGALRLYVIRAREVQRPDEAHRARRLIARLTLERVR